MYGALPTFCMVCVYKPFMKATHPLRHVTLRIWADNQTPICRFFDVALAISLLPLVVFIADFMGLR